MAGRLWSSLTSAGDQQVERWRRGWVGCRRARPGSPWAPACWGPNPWAPWPTAPTTSPSCRRAPPRGWPRSSPPWTWCRWAWAAAWAPGCTWWPGWSPRRWPGQGSSCPSSLRRWPPYCQVNGLNHDGNSEITFKNELLPTQTNWLGKNKRIGRERYFIDLEGKLCVCGSLSCQQ